MKIDTVGEKCFNCKACVCACPTDAISMEYPEGDIFKYPHINYDKCIECGKCSKVCPALKERQTTYTIDKCYYGYHKNDDIRKKSSSGGAFRAIADQVINRRGIVYSAYLDYTDMTVKFGNTRDIPIDALMKSKYVESDVGDSFKNIKNDLDNGKYVLFSGTPCQVSGLKQYLGKDYSNLFTVDFICHGLPAQKYFKEHCEYIEKKNKSKISGFYFRPKTIGWTPQCLDIRFTNGSKKDVTYINDSYFYGFMSKNIYLRKCCYSCPYSDNHNSDITIADFWGHSKSGLDIKNDEKGLSLILCNSKTGSEFLSTVENDMVIVECPSDVACYTIKKRVAQKDILSQREEFISLCNKIGFEKAAKRTYMRGSLESLLRSIKFKQKINKYNR